MSDPMDEYMNEVYRRMWEAFDKQILDEWIDALESDDEA